MIRHILTLSLTALLAASPAGALIAVDTFGDGFVVGLEARDDLLFALSNVASDGGTGDFVVYDATDPWQPVEISRTPLLLRGADFALDGDKAYVVAPSGALSRLRIFDITSPATPALLGFVDGPYGRIAVANGLAFLAGSALRVVDARNPAAPVEIDSLPLSPQDVATRGSTVYVAGGGGDLGVFDASDPASVHEITSFPLAYYLHRVDVVGDLLFAWGPISFNPPYTLFLFDISTPEAPLLLASVPVPGEYASDVEMRGDLAFLSTGEVLDLADPTAPVALGNWSPGGTDVALDGDAVYYPSPAAPEVRVVDGTEPRFPSLAGPPVAGGVSGANAVDVSGTVAYVAQGTAGLDIVNVADPAHAASVRVFDTPGAARDVDVVGSFAYVADGPAGLVIVDVSNPIAPVQRGSVTLPGAARAVVVDAGVAYVAMGSAGLAIIDVSNPAAPAVRASFPSFDARDVRVRGKQAFLADGQGGMRILDVANPAAPAQLGFYRPGSVIARAEVAGSVVYAADESFRLFVLDVSNPASPVQIGAARLNMGNIGTFGFDLAGTKLYAGAQVFEVSDPHAPRLLGGFVAPGHSFYASYPADLKVLGSRAFEAWPSGLYVVEFGTEYDPGAASCDVAMSQAAYANGETVRITSLRFANPQAAPFATRLRLQLVLPIGLTVDLLDLGAAGGFAIPAGFDFDLSPVTMFTVQPSQPRGDFTLRCRLEDPSTGVVRAADQVGFALQ